LLFDINAGYKNDVLTRIPDTTKLAELIGPYTFKSLDYSIEQCFNMHR
jgi:hypothetical protein